MKLQRKVRQKLVDKVTSDLSQGTKILGDYSNQNDAIRVWTTFQNIEFGIVATSSRRFKNSFDFIEVQAFLPGKEAVKMSILHKDGKTEIGFTKLNKNFIPSDDSSNMNQILSLFIESYLRSEVNVGLSKKYFERNSRNPTRFEHLAPRLRK